MSTCRAPKPIRRSTSACWSSGRKSRWMRFLTTLSSGTSINNQSGPAPGGVSSTTSPSLPTWCRQPSTFDHQAPSAWASWASMQISSNLRLISRLPLAPVLARSSLRSSLAFVFGPFRQLLLQHLAHRVARQTVHQSHLPRPLMRRKLLRNKVDQFLRVGVTDDERDDALTEIVVRRTDHRGLGDAGVAEQYGFDL